MKRKCNELLLITISFIVVIKQQGNKNSKVIRLIADAKM